MSGGGGSGGVVFNPTPITVNSNIPYNITIGLAGQKSSFGIYDASGGINGSITDTVITTTLKFNATYISTLLTALNISVTEGDAIEMVWLTPAWVTNPVNIFINTIL